MNDDELDSLIRQTHSQPVFPPVFQREVWARIAVAEERSWASRWRQWSQNVFLSLARPVPAVVMVTTMLIIGVSLGSLIVPERSTADLRTAYITSINPLRAAHVAIRE